MGEKVPPKFVESIKDLIFWRYANIISQSAGFGQNKSIFMTSRFHKLKKGDIKWPSSIQEWIKENERRDVCNYCDKKEENLIVGHILPLSRGGPDHPDNTVRICKECNLKKSNKRLYEFSIVDKKAKVPRIVEGKYLKLIYDLHDQVETLDIEEVGILCPYCDLKNKCEEFGTEEQLNVYCLEGIFKENFNSERLKNQIILGPLEQ
ncbi:MAG: HNH endonuclease [Promethearchaeota archaeon]